MTIVTQPLYSSGSDDAAHATMTFDDTNGAISRLDWVVNFGTLIISVFQNGVLKPGFPLTLTTSGSFNVPAGYNLTPIQSHGITNWVWQDANLSYEITWESPAVTAAKQK